jgi:hypothetical protein
VLWLGFCANVADENSVMAAVVERMIFRMMWAPSIRPKPEKLGIVSICSPAVDTSAAIAMKRASARSPGSSEMMKVTAVPMRV